MCRRHNGLHCQDEKKERNKRNKKRNKTLFQYLPGRNADDKKKYFAETRFHTACELT